MHPFFSAIVRCDEEFPKVDVNQIEASLNTTLPDSIKQLVNDFKPPKLEEIKDALKQKCEQTGADESAALRIEEEAQTLYNCTINLYDYENMTREIEEGKAKNALDQFFNK